MHTLVLCMWVLGIVSAADDQTQRPGYTISHNGSPQEYSSEQPFSGTPVTSNNVKVLPNSYETSQDLAGGEDSPISVPVLVNSNTQFQGNTNEPIPVPVSYSDDDSEVNETSQPACESYPVQTVPFRKVTPIPVLVKAPKSAYSTGTFTSRPFETRDPQLTKDKNTGNPYLTVSPSFRLWPKLPEPVPVPVLTAEPVLRNTYDLNTDLVPQYLRKVPIPVKAPASLSNGYQPDPNLVKFAKLHGQSDSFQSRQGPIYIIIPNGNDNTQTGSYQNPSSTLSSYQPQIPQSGTQRYIILNAANSQPSYQNSGYSLNPYFGPPVQQGQPGQLLNNGVGYGPSNAVSQTQAPSGQQAPINYAAPVSPNAPGSQLQTQYPDQQPALKYALIGPQSPPVGPANPAGQAPQNYAVLAPGSAPETQSNTAGQSPLAYAGFGPPNLQPAPPKFASYSSTQVPSPQYVGYSSMTQQPQYFGYSTTPAPSQPYSTQQPQNVGYPSSTQQPEYTGYSTTPAPSQPYSTQQPQNVGYPSSTQQPEYTGYSTTPAPSQPYSTQQPQYVGYSSSTQQPQNVGYPSPTQQPEYTGYSTTPAPSQPYSTQQPQYVGYPSPTQQPEYTGYSTTPAPSQPYSTQQPQYVGYSSSTQQPQNVGYSTSPQQPQYAGFSSTPAPFQPPSPQQPQYARYSSTPAPFQPPSTQQPQNVGYSSSTQQPQYVGYSTTPAPSQPNFSQSKPVSSVSYSGPGNSYSYFI